jgi:HEPN domain-containing protein
MGIEPSDEKVIGLLDGVLPEFESAARQILRSEKTGRASALWSLQIAIERTLKAYAQHKSGSFRQTHNLFELFDDLARYDIKADRNLLKKIPRDQDVIEDRYGLRGTPSIWEVFESYKAAVQFVAAMSGSFRRKFNVGGGGFLLRKAPWITLPTPESLIPRTT